MTKGAALRPLDPETLSNIIGSIYDCVVEPAQWQKTLGMIASSLSFANAVVGVTQLKPGAHELRVHTGFDDDWLAVVDEYTPDSIRLWGGMARIQSFPLGEPVVGSEVIAPEEMANSRYYRDILEPRRVIDAVLIALASEPQLVGYLAFNRLADVGYVGKPEVKCLRLLAPHLRRAVIISNLLDLQGFQAGALGSVFESMSCGALLVDEHLRVLHANSEVERMLGSADALVVENGVLGLRDPSAENALRDAVKQGAGKMTLLGRTAIGIPVNSRDGTLSMLHVLPLRQDDFRARRAAAAIFVVESERGNLAAVEAMAAMFNLTPTEAGIFAGLCRGMSLEDAGRTLGMATSTARTHLHRIFQKTGCKRQTELVALASRTSLNI